MRDGNYTSGIEDTIGYTLEELIPTSALDTCPELRNLSGPNPPQFTAEELTMIVKKQNKGSRGQRSLDKGHKDSMASTV